MNECSWIVSLIVLEVSPGGPSDTPSWTPRKPPRRARGLLGPKIVLWDTELSLKSDQILTAAESGNLAPPGPVRICSFFGPSAGPIFGWDFSYSFAAPSLRRPLRAWPHIGNMHAIIKVHPGNFAPPAVVVESFRVE